MLYYPRRPIEGKVSAAEFILKACLSISWWVLGKNRAKASRLEMAWHVIPFSFRITPFIASSVVKNKMEFSVSLPRIGAIKVK